MDYQRDFMDAMLHTEIIGKIKRIYNSDARPGFNIYDQKNQLFSYFLRTKTQTSVLNSSIV